MGREGQNILGKVFVKILRVGQKVSKITFKIKGQGVSTSGLMLDINRRWLMQSIGTAGNERNTRNFDKDEMFFKFDFDFDILHLSQDNEDLEVLKQIWSRTQMHTGD